ncbi:MAG: AAA family ATPase [Bacteroidota bacterium]
MKIAISGKGGVGKTTVAAALALKIAQRDQKVIAIDADPDSNFAACLGIPKELQKTIIPISQQVALIEERTGAKVKQYGQVFKLNPQVSDIADRYALQYDGVALLVLGAVEKGGGGCACPENVLIKALVTDLILLKNETLVMDMEAGIEHLGRGTAKGVDTMIVVVEPGQRSIETAHRIVRMGKEIGLTNIRFIGNKITNSDDELFIRNAFPEEHLLGMIPYSEEIRAADKSGKSVLDGLSEEIRRNFSSILDELLA